MNHDYKFSYGKKLVSLFLIFLVVSQNASLALADPSDEGVSICQDPNDTECHDTCTPYVNVGLSSIYQQSSRRAPHLATPGATGAELVIENQRAPLCKTWFATEDGMAWQLTNMGMDVIAAGYCAAACQATMFNGGIPLAGPAAAAAVVKCQRAVIAANLTELASVVTMQWQALSNTNGATPLETAGAWMSVIGLATSATGTATIMSGNPMWGGGIGVLGGAAAIGGGAGVRGENAVDKNNLDESKQNPTTEANGDYAEDETLNNANEGVLGTIGAVKFLAAVARMAMILKGSKGAKGTSKAPGINACINTGLYAAIGITRMASVIENCKIKTDTCQDIMNVHSHNDFFDRHKFASLERWIQNHSLIRSANASPTGSRVNAAFAQCNSGGKCFTDDPSFAGSIDGGMLNELGMTDQIASIASGFNFDALHSGDIKGTFTALATHGAASTGLPNNRTLSELIDGLGDLAQVFHDNPSLLPNNAGARSHSGTVASVTNLPVPSHQFAESGSLFSAMSGNSPGRAVANLIDIFHGNSDESIFQIVSARIVKSCPKVLGQKACDEHIYKARPSDEDE